MGKALANGAPLSILLTNQEIFAYAEQARITGTFSKELFGIYCALATLKIMEDSSGWKILKENGKKISEIFNRAIRDSGLDEKLHINPIFDGTMFEVGFSKCLVSDLLIRRSLALQFTNENILLLQGHPSFICLDHSLIVWDQLKFQIQKILQKWDNEKQKPGENH